ncbi:Rhamnogalacturonase A [Mollisia scopiformis]|uniref:Rhamnogalacturonase A n=1 Tax=Mollisia scopiformis TaxID=149040 RepID=A0A194WXZ6_MOLSC|nr:Rhamnogalacturonase A [Mollisia scopiformis]KUJ12472.1 Rhamnogalacturonase A [Mollisia scopiformis]
MKLLLTLLNLLPLISAQLSGPVGPTTSRASKRTKVCNVLDYGGVASKTSDVGPPLTSAFAACKNGGTVYVPPGDFGISTFVSLTGGKSWALQLDGVIYRVGTGGGNMIFVGSTSDFEMYSSTSKGAIQGYGYTFHADGNYGSRILRLGKVSDFSVHDIALVDAGAFHLVMDTCTNGEIYNMIIRGGNEGGLDGIDIWGSNIHVHDVEVTNRDECVTVKSPASNMLIENIYCNWSGGCAMGSLGSDTAISNIHYRNIYSQNSNQMYMLKSRGGSGSVKNCTFESFIGHTNAYTLDLNADWSSQKEATGDGVLYQDITFRDWRGTCSNGVQRGPVNIVCPDKVPCTGLVVEDFAVWTEAGSSVVWKCANAYGSGACLKGGSGTGYAVVTSTISAAPSGYAAQKMPDDLTAGFALTASIPIPAVPTTFFPGATPASTLLGG